MRLSVAFSVSFLKTKEKNKMIMMNQQYTNSGKGSIVANSIEAKSIEAESIESEYSIKMGNFCISSAMNKCMICEKYTYPTLTWECMTSSEFGRLRTICMDCIFTASDYVKIRQDYEQSGFLNNTHDKDGLNRIHD